MSLSPPLSGENALAIAKDEARELLSMTILDSLGNISYSFESCEINRIEIKVAVPQAVHHEDCHITDFLWSFDFLLQTLHICRQQCSGSFRIIAECICFRSRFISCIRSLGWNVHHAFPIRVSNSGKAQVECLSNSGKVGARPPIKKTIP